MTDISFLDTTINEWRVELERIDSSEGDEGYTTQELARKFGCSERVMQKNISKMIKAEKCKKGEAKRKMPSGGIRIVPVYQLIKKEEEGK